MSDRTTGTRLADHLEEIAPGVWRLDPTVTPPPCPGPCALCMAAGRHPDPDSEPDGETGAR